jgi:hypothetical protein
MKKQAVAEVIGDGKLADEVWVEAGREDDRPSEDDIAKRKLGEQGIPGQPPKPPIADEDTLQIPKPLDPGHTA